MFLQNLKKNYFDLQKIYFYLIYFQIGHVVLQINIFLKI